MAGAAESAIATDVHLVPPSKPLGRLKEAMSMAGLLLKISPMASGDPQPMPPDSSFRFHMIRLKIMRAFSSELSAILATSSPMAVTLRNLISSSLL